MNIIQKNILLRTQIITCLFLFLFYINPIFANEILIKKLDFSTLAGDKVQVQLEMTGRPVEPKVFQTDKPARIALDFVGVKNGLKQKNFPINKGVASDVYVIESSGRTRVIINLIESVPYETKIIGNKVLITLKKANSVAEESIPPSTNVTSLPNETVAVEKKSRDKSHKSSIISRLLPQQSIKDIDFKRGAMGEGLLLVKLANPNTVVDAKEKGGKVVLKFLNTHLPEALRKRFDVSDFATPVQKIDVVSRGINTEITITTADGNYEYSSFQDQGMLTVDFRPMTSAEKEAAKKEKFPFTGDKLSLNFQDIDIRSVLQILADFTEFNIVVSDSVGGNVTLLLNDVPWDQALELILKSKGLAKRESGNVVLVAPSVEITKLEEEELAAKAIVEQLEPLRTEYIQINYAKAADIKKMLLGGTSATGAATTNASSTAGTANLGLIATGRLISLRGVATVDERTNILIVKDTADRMEDIRELIKELDVPVRQVMIEARIVNADKNFARDLGVRFGIAKATTGIGNDKSFSFAGANTVVKTANIFNGENPVREIEDNNYLVDLASAGANAFPPAALGMTLARAADYVLNLEISALEGDNRGELVSNPRVLTSDRVEATIQQGTEIPFTTVSADGTETELVDAVLELKVTPQITPNGSIIMELAIKNDAANDVGGINTEQIETTVQINDGETVVLGGIYSNSKTHTVTKVPFFGDLPVIGFLFKNTQDTDRKQELLIFVTPKIVKDFLSKN